MSDADDDAFEDVEPEVLTKGVVVWQGDLGGLWPGPVGVARLAPQVLGCIKALLRCACYSPDLNQYL